MLFIGILALQHNSVCQKYSLFQISIHPQSKFFCFLATTQNIKTCNIPLKGPIKWLLRMQKKIWNFQLFLDFLGHFWKISVLEKWVWQAWNGVHAHPFCFHFSQNLTSKLCWKFQSRIFICFKFTHFPKTRIFRKWP